MSDNNLINQVFKRLTNQEIFSMNDLKRTENKRLSDMEDYNPTYPHSSNEMVYLCNAETNIKLLEEQMTNIFGKDIYILIKEFAGIDQKTLKTYNKPDDEINKYYKSSLLE